MWSHARNVLGLLPFSGVDAAIKTAAAIPVKKTAIWLFADAFDFIS